MPLTDTACRNAKCAPDRKYQRHADAGGLYLEVTRTGAKCWRWKFRHAGKEKRLALGLYPAVTLAAARKSRDAARELLSRGTDPSAAKREARLATLEKSETAFEKVARQWWDQWRANKAERHAGYVLTRLEADAFPEIGGVPVGDLTAPAFVRMAKKIDARGAAEISRRVLATCNQVMRYAVAHGIAERNPLGDVKPSDIFRPRERSNFARIDVGELPALLRRIDAYPGTPFTRYALQLMALTFVRTGELIGARWSEFDLPGALWKIPAERTKSRREHAVPLSRQALEVLQCLQAAHGDATKCQGDALLFPGERDRSRSISNGTLLRALARMGYRGRMTGHGFRGVASTALNEMGYRPDVIEAQLAHLEENRVRAAYNHARYSEERRDLMQNWADYLTEIRTSGKVLPMVRRRTRKAA